MRQSIVHLCYSLEESARYKRAKGLVFDLLVNPHSRWRGYFDSGMILVVLASITLLILEVRTPLHPAAQVFQLLVVVVFIIEYLLRFWLNDDIHAILLRHHEQCELLNTPFDWATLLREIAGCKWRFITSPMAIIDLLAILPSYRPLRVLRIFLLFRLFKLFRYTRSINEFSQVLSEKRFELYTLSIFIGFVLFAASTAIFLFEGQQPGSDIQSMYDAFYWALVTLTTVGYGDITPHTGEGRVIAMALIVSSIGVLAFATSIVVSAFTEKMATLREHQVFSEVERGRAFTLICGYGQLGEQLAADLIRTGKRVVVVDNSDTAITRARQHGYLALCGDPSENELLVNLCIADRITTLLCLTDDDVANVYITLTARSLNPDLHIIARANRDENEPKLKLAGATQVVKPYHSLAAMAAAYVGQPVASEAMQGLIGGRQELIIDTIILPAELPSKKLLISQLDLTRYHLNLFGVVDRSQRSAMNTPDSIDWEDQRFYFNPPEEFELNGGDVLVLFGPQKAVTHFKDSIEQNRFERLQIGTSL